MATSLSTARSGVSTALAGITTAQRYTRRQTNYQFPCFLVSWPTRYDVNPDQGDERDFDLIVSVGVEITEDDSSDDLLSSLLDSAAAALLTANAAWGVGPASNFGEALTEDGRAVIWADLPVQVMS